MGCSSWPDRAVGLGYIPSAGGSRMLLEVGTVLPALQPQSLGSRRRLQEQHPLLLWGPGTRGTSLAVSQDHSRLALVLPFSQLDKLPGNLSGKVRKQRHLTLNPLFSPSREQILGWELGALGGKPTYKESTSASSREVNY